MAPWTRTCLTASLIVLCGCQDKNICDEGKVQQATALLANSNGRPWERGDAAVLLGEACNLNEGVVKGVQLQYGDAAALQRDTYLWSEDETFTALMRELCKDPNAATAAARKDNHQAVFDACQFGNLGVLEADEPYIPRYRAALVLFYALRRAGMEQARARAIARFYIASVAPGDDVRHYPKSTSRHLGSQGFVVSLQPDRLVAGELDLPLVKGLVAPDEGHELSPLRVELTRATERATAQVETGKSVVEPGRLIIAAHAQIPVRTLVDTMFAGYQTGHTQIELAVQRRGERQAIPLAGPRRWVYWSNELDDELSPPPAAPQVRASLSDGRLALDMRDQPVGVASASDLGAIEGLALTAAKELRGHRMLELRVEPDLELSELVTVMEALHGKDCPAEFRAGPAYEVPRECNFETIELDLLPGIPRLGAARPLVQLDVKLVSRKDDRSKDAPDDAELAARVRKAFPAIKRCIETHSDSQMWQPNQAFVAFGFDGSGQLCVGSGVWAQLGAVMPHECIQASLELPKLAIEHYGSMFATAHIELVWASP